MESKEKQIRKAQQDARDLRPELADETSEWYGEKRRPKGGPIRSIEKTEQRAERGRNLPEPERVQAPPSAAKKIIKRGLKMVPLVTIFWDWEEARAEGHGVIVSAGYVTVEQFNPVPITFIDVANVLEEVLTPSPNPTTPPTPALPPGPPPDLSCMDMLGGRTLPVRR